MTREEAIKRIKARFDKLALDDRDIEAIQTLIPELRESEDERMLREIKRYIKEQGDKPTGLPKGTVAVYDMIDWLEKQKESLHISETCKENADSFTDEDERIRKEIISALKFANVGGVYDKHIVYLEKQKEQKVDIDKLRKDIYQSGYNDGYRHGKEDAQKEQKPELCDMGRWDEESYNNGIHHVLQNSEAYGFTKQKPAEASRVADDVVSEAEEYTSKVSCGEYGVEVTEAYIAGVLSERNRGTEWSEFDKGVLKDAICATDTLGNDESFNKSNPNLAKAFRVAKDWLKSLPERLNLQPKQEWGEEDEKMLSNLITHIKVAYSSCDWLTETIAWLKTLRLDLKKKNEDVAKLCSNEWSEEDEETMKGIMQCIFDNVVNIGTVNKVRYVDWLKSLRPQQYCENCKLKRSVENWKPSKEQMCYLKKVYESYDFCDGERNALESLYNDLLKKLGVKEEPKYYQHFDTDC